MGLLSSLACVVAYLSRQACSPKCEWEPLPITHYVAAFSIENHHFQGRFSMISSFSIEKSTEKWPVNVQYAVAQLGSYWEPRLVQRHSAAVRFAQPKIKQAPPDHLQCSREPW